MAAILKDSILKNRGPVHPSVLRLLTVNNGGAAITEKLAHWKSKVTDTPYAAPVITVTHNTGKITASRVVVRGPLFSAVDNHKVPANQIWPAAREDLEVSFLIDGTAVTFHSDEAPNVSDWIDVRTLRGFTVTDTTSCRDLTEREINEEEGMAAGACVRVALHIHTVHYLAATLQVQVVFLSLSSLTHVISPGCSSGPRCPQG